MTPETIGHYRITARIGAGGMGEVYRARDTKLGRDVAIKVLPPAFAEDANRMARFEREARVLASLNHPNIAQIYGVEEHALVMELVEGESPKGPMPFDDTWKIAMQMADALEYAHDKGVVHRDLKPANVKVTPDGVVKLLDFGLAKAYSDQPDPASGDPSLSPTVTLGATVAGTIMGTAAYMSPEQARGKPVDKRADIWSWGVVLYELLTGERLFQGDDAAETLAQVLTKQPDLERVPFSVRKVLLRCLAKDPKNRLRDISLAKELLEEKPQAEARATSKLPWMAAAMLAIALGGVSWFAWRATRAVARPLARLEVDLGADVLLPPADSTASSVILSPDGTRLVYVSGPPARLFTRRLDQPTATELPGTQGAVAPFFSPDGQWVGFFAGHGLNKISVEGGAVVPLADMPVVGGASWGSDGTIVVGGAYTGGLARLPAGGGAPTPLLKPGKGELAQLIPQILPGGKAVLFVAFGSAISADQASIDVLTLADGRRKTLVRGGTAALYLPSGHLIYLNKSTLFAVPFDLDRLETRGNAVPVLDDVAFASTTNAPAALAFSSTGVLIYRRGAPGGTSGLTTVQWLDRAGNKQPLLTKPGPYADLNLSPDGKRLALLVNGADLGLGIWVYDHSRDATTHLTFGGGPYTTPVWTPDGRYIVFGSPTGMLWTGADGAGQPRPLTQTRSVEFPQSFTRDGKHLAYSGPQSGNLQIWTVPVEEQGGQLKAGTPVAFLKTQFHDFNPAFSPDGRWLAYQSNASGKSEVYVRAFPAPASGQAGQWQISNDGGANPVWSRASHELLYRTGNQVMAVSYTVNGDSFVAEKPRVWLDKFTGIAFDLDPNGKRIAALMPVTESAAPAREHTVIFLENFFDYLKQRVPVK